MTGFFKGDDLERKLRTGKPQASDGLVQRIEGRVRADRASSRRGFRLALPAVFTVVVLGGLAAVGGVSYAATSVVHAAKTVSHVFTPASAHHVAVAASRTSGGDQYSPATAWGATAYTTDAAPTVAVGDAAPGAFTPPLTPTVDGPTATVETSFKLVGLDGSSTPRTRVGRGGQGAVVRQLVECRVRQRPSQIATSCIFSSLPMSIWPWKFLESRMVAVASKFIPAVG